MIYPNLYLNKVEEITVDILNKNKIKALILDVDNTLIDYKKNLSEDIIEWSKTLQGQGIRMYILSKEIAKKVEDELEYPGNIKINLIRETRQIEYAK